MGACSTKGSAGTPRRSGGISSSLPSSEQLQGCLNSREILDHKAFIVDNDGNIADHYDIDKNKIGEGSYGFVYKSQNKQTKMVRAVKAISKRRMKAAVRFRREVAIMKMMDHPNLIKLFETFEDHRYGYVVMELCEGGELFDHIAASKHFTEGEAAVVMQQILRAVNYIHGKRTCHRDIKPDNFLFQSRGAIEDNVLKLIDFGLARIVGEGGNLTTKSGTPYYVAPEVLSGHYKESCDLWSCGVIMYVLLCGYPPFSGESEANILAKVRNGTFSFPAAEWDHVSGEAKDLIRKLLTISPKLRCTAQQALRDEWISRTAPRGAKVEMKPSYLEHLRRFQSANKFKKAALHVIAGELSKNDIAALRKTFVALDSDGDGLLTMSEMRDGLSQAGIARIPVDLRCIMEDMDSNGSGSIDYTEFLAASLDRKLYSDEEVCWSAFRVFDRNGDGKISTNELKQMLSADPMSDIEDVKCIEDIMVEIDGNGDGMIDFSEFMHMMQKDKSPSHNVRYVNVKSQ